jgi:Tol biopolymer transport system component
VNRLVWTRRDGGQSAVTSEPALYFHPRLSPDGVRAAVTLVEPQTGNLDVWLIDLPHVITTRFTFDPAPDNSPVWSPDGKQIAFSSSRDGRIRIYLKPANGSASEEPITPAPGITHSQYPCDWSRDGRYLLYTEIGGGTGADLWVLPMTPGAPESRKPVPFLQSPFNKKVGNFSPDVKWIAYTSDESGRDEVYVRGFPGASGRFQISNNGGAEPRWREDGRELYYRAPDGKLMAVAVRPAAGSLERETPKALFETHWLPPNGLMYGYDVTRDGQRFLGPVPVETETGRALTLMTKWQALVKP